MVLGDTQCSDSDLLASVGQSVSMGICISGVVSLNVEDSSSVVVDCMYMSVLENTFLF